jgi:CHRD domain
MRHSNWLSLTFIPLIGFVALTAQQPKTFKARLSPVPIDVSMQATIAGSGSVSAVLTGTKLAITGTFDGLKSPATIAQIHKGPVRGVRGPNVFDLTVSKTDAASGTLSGSFDLTPLQLADLEKGRLYVQLHSEKAPDGNLWGWLLPQENRR